MKQRILIEGDIYRKLSQESRKVDLTPDELAEAFLKKQLKIK